MMRRWVEEEGQYIQVFLPGLIPHACFMLNTQDTLPTIHHPRTVRLSAIHATGVTLDISHGRFCLLTKGK